MEGRSEGCNVEKTWPSLVGFEDGGRGPRAKECGWPLKAGKGKGMDSVLEIPENNATLVTL